MSVLVSFMSLFPQKVWEHSWGLHLIVCLFPVPLSAGGVCMYLSIDIMPLCPWCRLSCHTMYLQESHCISPVCAYCILPFCGPPLGWHSAVEWNTAVSWLMHLVHEGTHIHSLFSVSQPVVYIWGTRRILLYVLLLLHCLLTRVIHSNCILTLLP